MRSLQTSATGALNRVMAGEVNAQIIVSGSSRALVQYDPAIIQRVTGKTAYNIGRNGSHIDMQLALLKACLHHNRKPELVVHNLDLHSFIPTHELYDPAQFIPFIDDPDLYPAIRRINSGSWKWRYVPLYGYAVEDMRFTWLLGVRGTLGINPPEDHFLGYNPRDSSWTGDFDRFKAQNSGGFKVEMEEQGRNALRELIELCAHEGIRLVLVYSPEYIEAQELTSNRGQIFAAFRDLATKSGVAFWDYSASPVSREREFFYNSQHLNRRGAEAFSLELAKRIEAEILPARK